MKNPIVDNFINNFGHALNHLYVLDPRLYRYRNVVIYGMDEGANAIFTSAMQFCLRITAFCDDGRADFPYLNRALDYIPTIAREELGALPDRAVLCSKETFRQLEEGELDGADVYVADADMDKKLCAGTRAGPVWILDKAALKKPAVLFGAGDQGRAQVEMLLEDGVEIQAFCDNDPEKRDTVYCGKPVLSPERLKELAGEASVICAAEEWEPVYRQLRLMGFGESDIFVNTVRLCHFRHYFSGVDRRGFLMRDTLFNVIYQYNHGKTILEQLTRNTDAPMLLFPTNSIGDIVIPLAYLAAYQKEQHLSKIICLVSRKRKFITGLFPSAKDCIHLTEPELNALWDYLFLTGGNDRVKIVYYKRQTWLRDFWTSSGVEGASFMAELRYALGVKSESAAHISVPAKNSGHVLPGSVLLIMTGAIKEVYGKDFDESHRNFLFSSVVNELTGRGIRVYTNIASARDYVFENTEALDLPIPQLLETAGYFKCIVSMPSGLGELLALTECNLVSVFPEVLECHRVALDRFADRDNAVTVRWEKGREQEVVDAVVEKVMGFQPPASTDGLDAKEGTV